jgi:large subunit ribosomal protein L4
MKAAALRGALSDRTSHGRLAVVSAFVEGDEPSTREALTVLRTAVGVTATRLERPVLVVVSVGDAITHKSLRNAPRVRVLDSGQLNTYDVLACDHVVFTQAALAEFVARTGGELVTVDKPAKPARAAKAKAAAEAAEDGDEPAAKPARAAKAKAAAEAAEDGDEPAAKPARAAKAKAAAEDGAEDGEEPDAKPAKATASRARKPAAAATEPADDADSDEAGPAVKQRSSGASRKAASSGSGAAQKEEDDE